MQFDIAAVYTCHHTTTFTLSMHNHLTCIEYVFRYLYIHLVLWYWLVVCLSSPHVTSWSLDQNVVFKWMFRFQQHRTINNSIVLWYNSRASFGRHIKIRAHVRFIVTLVLTNGKSHIWKKKKYFSTSYKHII